jgi:proline iminopeptidase
MRTRSLTPLAAIVLCIGCSGRSEQPTPLPSSGSVEVDGAKLSFVRQGEGPPLLVIGSSTYYPRAFSQELRTHFEMLFVDSRHFAAGYEPTDDDLKHLTLDRFADDVEIIRDELGLQEMIVLGHSVHAQIAMAYARKYPEHTRGLVLVAGVPYAMGEFAEAARLLWDREASAERKAILAANLEDLDERLAAAGPSRSFAVGYQANGPQYWADAAYDASALLEGVENTPALPALFGAVPTRSDVRDTLEAIDAPVLVVLGRLDFAIPHTVWEELLSGLNSVTYVLLEEDSHNLQTEAPTRFDPRLLEWYRSLRDGTGAP